MAILIAQTTQMLICLKKEQHFRIWDLDSLGYVNCQMEMWAELVHMHSASK